jgi:hypothetical protein
MFRTLSLASLLVGLIFVSSTSILSQNRRIIRVRDQRSVTSVPENQGSVRLYPAVVRLQKGKTKTITTAAYDANGAPVFNASFDSFSTSSSSIVSLSTVLVSGDDISAPGAPPPNLRTVSGNSPGVAYISATWNGVVSNSIQVVVDDPSAMPISVVNGDNSQSGGSLINTRVGEPIELNAEASQGVERIDWKWGDGDSTSDLLSATHAYMLPGTYELAVKVTNRSGQSATSRITVNVSAHPEPTAVIVVESIAELMTAYNNAVGGEHIVIPAGSTWIGEISLPAKNFSDYVTIRSSASMPALTERITPNANGLVTLKAPYGNGVPLRIENGATRIRLVGLKFEPKYIPDVNGPSTYYLLQIGAPFTQTTTATNPSRIIVEHCVINPPDDVNVVHGILNDGYKVSILSSWLGNIKTFGGQDSQAVISFDGKGAHVYNNTYFEAASENIMYGGAVPTIPGLTPTNIEVRRCYFSKRMAWRVYNVDYHQVNVKNLFETKNARRIYIEGSVMENHWDAMRSQLFALVFKSSVSPGMPGEFVPWAVSEDIVLENNRLHRMFGGITTAVDSYWLGNFRGMKPNNIIVKNTLFDDLSNRWGAPGNSNGGRLVQPNNVEDLSLDHVTMIDTDRTAGSAVVLVTNNNFRFKVTNSIFGLGGYGIIGSGVGPGTRSLNFGTGGVLNVCSPDNNATWGFSNNVMPFYGNDTTCFPRQEVLRNSFPLDYQSVGFNSLGAGDYGLTANSPFRGTASDGTDPGVDWPVLSARTACSVSGRTATCLSSTASTYTVTGRVVNEAGVGLSRVQTWLTDELGNQHYASTNALGHFSFSNLPVGNYVAHARVKLRQVSRAFTLTPTLGKIELEMPD